MGNGLKTAYELIFAYENICPFTFYMAIPFEKKKKRKHDLAKCLKTSSRFYASASFTDKPYGRCSIYRSKSTSWENVNEVGLRDFI